VCGKGEYVLKIINKKCNYEYAVIGIARGLKWYVYIDCCGIMYV